MSSDDHTSQETPESPTSTFEEMDREEEPTRRRFVSRHRHTLDRIQSDSKQQTQHSVGLRSTPSYHATKKTLGQRLSQTLWTDATPPNSFQEWLTLLLPAYGWLQTYQWRTTLWSDAMAGLTVGIMIVPQGMSYAKLAGLPVEFGLYSALIPVYAYSLFGSSRQLAVGPVALISLIVSTGLPIVLEGDGITVENNSYQAEYNQLAVQVSFLVGLCYIGMGLCRMGFVTIFLSHAVISGFTTAAAIIIGLSQVKYLFGYDIKKSDTLQGTLSNLIDGIDDFNYRTFLMGSLSVMMLVGLKQVGKQYPKFKWARAAAPLIVTVLAIVLTVSLDLKNSGIPVVGNIPKGFPSITVSDWTPLKGNASDLLVVVISIVIVGFMESIAIAKQLASKHKYEIDASTELIGLGMANFCGSIFSSYPITGSFSRSAVNHETGAKSGVAGMVTATIVCVTLLFLTPIFQELPLNTLAAIVISGVIGLLDYPEAIYLWKVHKFDFMVWTTACLGTLFAGVEIGLAIAVGVSLLIVVYESAYPQMSVMGRLPGTSHYRNVKQYPEAEIYDGIVIVRIDAPLYFANAQNVRDKIRKYRLKAEEELAAHNGDVKYLILELSPVSHIDTSALHQLEAMVENYRSRGQEMVFTNPSLRVMERLVASGLADRIGDEFFFASLHDAVNSCLHNMDEAAISIHAGSVDNDDDSNSHRDVEAGVEEPSMSIKSILAGDSPSSK